MKKCVLFIIVLALTLLLTGGFLAFRSIEPIPQNDPINGNDRLIKNNVTAEIEQDFETNGNDSIFTTTPISSSTIPSSVENSTVTPLPNLHLESGSLYRFFKTQKEQYLEQRDEQDSDVETTTMETNVTVGLLKSLEKDDQKDQKP